MKTEKKDFWRVVQCLRRKAIKQTNNATITIKVKSTQSFMFHTCQRLIFIK
jgi:hypothetical protein